MGTASLPMDMLRSKIEFTELTATERQGLKMLAMGETQVSIAAKTGRSTETVRKQMKMVRARLGAKTNAHAVAIAISLDLI